MVVEPDDEYSAATLEEAAAATGLVVRGTVTGEKSGVQIGMDTSIRYTLFEVDVKEVLSGPEVTRVQVAISTEVDGQPMAVDGRVTPTVGDDIVWLLQPIAEEFGVEGYVLTAQTGLVHVVDNSVEQTHAHDILSESVAESDTYTELAQRIDD